MPEIPIPSFNRSRRRTRVYDADRDNLNEVVEALAASLAPAGSLIPTLASSAPGTGGWLLCDGSAVAKKDYPTLYAELGGEYGETETTFTLPDLRGRMPMGIGGAAALALGALLGSHQITLSVGQLPSHGHAISDPGHTHAFTGSPHGHGVTDPGHGHGVTDPGHAHDITDPGHNHDSRLVSGGTGGFTGTSTATLERTSTDTTGITVDSATTGVTVNSGTTGVSVSDATAGGTNASSTTGVTVNPTGNGDPVEILPPVVGVNWLVRT